MYMKTIQTGANYMM